MASDHIQLTHAYRINYVQYILATKPRLLEPSLEGAERQYKALIQR